jgi:4'-phosphopantetheinyl transferase EntD
MDVVEVAGLFDHALVLSAPISPETIGALRPSEVALVANALPKRLAEFATGRALAHLALAQLGSVSDAVVNDERRAPIWPIGIRGSITHCDTRALVALCRDRDGSVGIDVEHRSELKRDLWESVFLAEEIADLGRLSEPERGRMALVLFSAKESLYKAQFPISRTYMGFRALRVQAERGQLICTFQEDVPPFARGTIARGRYFSASVPSGEVLTGVHIPVV